MAEPAMGACAAGAVFGAATGGAPSPVRGTAADHVYMNISIFIAYSLIACVSFQLNHGGLDVRSCYPAKFQQYCSAATLLYR